MKILVTGADGQLGADVVKELIGRGYDDVLGTTKDDLDVCSKKAVQKFIMNYHPNVIVHCAAWTAVDKAEELKKECDAVNRIGTKNIAECAKNLDAKLVYISTDYVFGGNGEELFETDSPKNPLSVYGKTKYLGELEAKKCKKHFIVRTSWVFGANGNNFVKTMLRLSKSKTELNVVGDQIGSPTYTVDLAKLLCDMIETEKYGTYHATNENFCSWAEFAKKIFELSKIKTVKVNSVSTEEYQKMVPQQAVRPLNSRLSKKSLDEAGFKRLPNWQDALQRYLKELEEVEKKQDSKKLPKVAVLMSTYNGEKFLKEQIDSILTQTNVCVDLHIFDDCSSDGTVSIVKDYMKTHSNIFLTENSENKNFTYNFIEALETFKTSDKYDFYAFSDQDDFWTSDKLSSAITKIKERGKCILYSSNLKLVDEDLKPMNRNLYNKKRICRNRNILNSNKVTGCTIVMDNDFKNLATKYHPENIYLHDYWYALIAYLCENAKHIFDLSPDHILYRQHGNNLVGGEKPNNFEVLFEKIDNKKSTQRLVDEFNKLYSEFVSERTKKLLSKLVNYKKLKNKLWLLFDFKDNFGKFFRLKILFNNY